LLTRTAAERGNKGFANPIEWPISVKVTRASGTRGLTGTRRGYWYQGPSRDGGEKRGVIKESTDSGKENGGQGDDGVWCKEQRVALENNKAGGNGYSKP